MNTNQKATPLLIVEFEFWSPPGSPTLAVEGKPIAARCHKETGLPKEVILGLNFVPDEQDAERLQGYLHAGEVRVEDFLLFCKKHGLAPDSANSRSAAEYLVHIEGQPLAWLHITAESSGLATAQALWRWAEQNNLQVRDGGYTNDLLSEAQVYKCWSGAA